MLTTGNQLKAARMLAEIEQVELAKRVGMNVNTIRNMEASASGAIAGRSQNVQAVQRILEAAGVEFLNHGQPGVRLAKLAQVRSEQHDAVRAKSDDDVRVGAAGVVDRALADVDATKQEKADRRGALTDEAAVVARARNKGRNTK